MCYAVRIVVAAPTPDRRMELRRAAVGAEWEVVADAPDAEQALAKARALRAQILVIDAASAGSAASDIATELAALRPRTLLVGVGEVAGADASVASDGLGDLRSVLAELLHDSGHHVH